ncbi:Predicted dienelactone hydrolase [Evansella caseinilytica]|uniref:Predicted dienelactone hydrolase n=1 Tax=Evansella caseinilytica TaxID=1503961 RepID=A0A1H3RKF0_9BACI|nr:hypothetical protein [Evansella caseinilytica]SDZ26136.1 Predicted dienelactone hydrolase [Evansella caseinilytica]
MKLTEICLLLITSIMLYGYVFGFLTVKKRGIVLAASGMMIFLFHTVIDGFRIQLIPLYALFAICTISCAIYAFFQKNSHPGRKPKLWKRIAAGTAGTLAVAAALIVPLYLLPIIKIMEPTGPYAIGTTEYHWVDQNREETNSADPTDRRELLVRVWYPAEVTAEAEKAPYALEPEQGKLAGRNLSFFYRMVLHSVMKAENHSYAGVPVTADKQQYPVLVFSHGYGLSNFMYTNQIENLASHGYIVFSIEHPYYAGIPTIFPDGRIVEEQVDLTNDDIDLDEEINIWIADVLFALDNIEALNETDPQGILTGMLDISRIGMFGHSFGGAATSQVMHRDSRIQAGVNMDGFFFGPIIEEGLENPFMYLTAAAEAYMENPDGSRMKEEEMPEELLKELQEMRADDLKRKEGILKNGGSVVVLEGGEHESFSDMMLYSPLMVTRDLSLLEKINQELLQFFDEHLKSPPSQKEDGA